MGPPQEKFFIYQLEKQDVRALSSEGVKSMYGGHLSEHTIRKIPIKKGSRKVDVVLSGDGHGPTPSTSPSHSAASTPQSSSLTLRQRHQQQGRQQQGRQQTRRRDGGGEVPLDVAVHVATVTIPLDVMLQRYMGLYKEMLITTDHCSAAK